MSLNTVLPKPAYSIYDPNCSKFGVAATERVHFGLFDEIEDVDEWETAVADFARRLDKVDRINTNPLTAIRTVAELERAEYERSPEYIAKRKREDPANFDPASPEYKARAAEAAQQEERARLARVRHYDEQRAQEAAKAAHKEAYEKAVINLATGKIANDQRPTSTIRYDFWEQSEQRETENRTALAALGAPVRVRTLLQSELKPVAEIVPGLVEKGIVNCLDGPGGSHKSRLALQLAIAVAAGAWMLGGQLTKCQAIFLSSEDAADEIHRRAAAMTARPELPKDNGAWIWDLTSKDACLVEVAEGGKLRELPFYTALSQHLQTVPGHKFVVLDSLFDFVRYLGKAKLDEGAVNRVFKGPLTKLCTDCDATLLVIRHPSQSGMERGDMSGWSVANHNSIRSRLSLAPKKDARDAYVLKVEKRNHGPAGKELTLYYTDGCLLPRDSMDAAQQQAVANAAIVQVAVDEAVSGRPLNKRDKLTPAQLAKFRAAAGGFPVTEREIENVLEDHSGVGKPLVRVRGSSMMVAGFFPAENGAELSRKLKNPK
jgi:RecA-family ATPase